MWLCGAVVGNALGLASKRLLVLVFELPSFRRSVIELHWTRSVDKCQSLCGTRFFIRNTPFGFSLGVSFSQIQPKMFLRCFLKYVIIFWVLFFVSLLLRHFILFVSKNLIMILFAAQKPILSNLLSLDVS